MENFIKDHKNGLHSDRTSCHRFDANQFRLFLHCKISPHSAPDYRLIRHPIIAASGTPKSFDPAPFC
jgi:hypothetical protein